jgi:hypothetical protein
MFFGNSIPVVKKEVNELDTDQHLSDLVNNFQVTAFIQVLSI